MLKKFLLFIILSLIFIQGCATPRGPHVGMGRPEEKGFYHLVKKGETLWRIAKTYNIDANVIASANRLPDATNISTGQLLFIPKGRDDVRFSNNANYFGKQSFIWPVDGEVVSFFGAVKDGVKNKGIDIKSDEGIPVKAARSGKVIFSDEKVKGLGKTIIVDHGDEFSTIYAHNSEILVKVGDIVDQGDIIAKVGSSGRVQSANLHFEIRKKHEPQNPFYFLP